MKYFLGITPPEEIKERIFSFQKSFKNNTLPRIFEPHITVKTKNGLGEDLGWLEKARLVVEDYPKFVIIFEGVDTFGDGVVILRPRLSEKLLSLHKALFQAIKPSEDDTTKKYFENDKYEPHFTLGMDSWGMTKEELVVMREKAVKELSRMPEFEVSFVRVYRQIDLDKPYEKFVDISLSDE